MGLVNTRNKAIGAAAAVLFGHAAARAIAANAVRRESTPDGSPGLAPEDVNQREVIQGQAEKAEPRAPFGGPLIHPGPVKPTKDFTLIIAEQNEIGEYGHASYVVNMAVPAKQYAESTTKQYLAGTLKAIEQMRKGYDESEEDDD